MDDELTCYVLATIAGPFGEMQQVSARMRPSEAAATCAHFMPFDAPANLRAPVRIKNMQIVYLRKETK